MVHVESTLLSAKVRTKFYLYLKRDKERHVWVSDFGIPNMDKRATYMLSCFGLTDARSRLLESIKLYSLIEDNNDIFSLELRYFCCGTYKYEIFIEEKEFIGCYKQLKAGIITLKLRGKDLCSWIFSKNTANTTCEIQVVGVDSSLNNRLLGDFILETFKINGAGSYELKHVRKSKDFPNSKERYYEIHPI